MTRSNEDACDCRDERDHAREGVDRGERHDDHGGTAAGDGDVPSATVQELEQCQFHVWYPRFGPRYAGRVVSIPLDDAFAAYLRSDGMKVSDASRAFGRPASSSSSSSSASSDASAAAFAAAWIASDSEDDDLAPFAGLVSQIDDAIAKLGGSVLARLNWSSPRDATWMNPFRTMRCTNADEVILMIKASDRIASDLYDPATSAAAAASTLPCSSSPPRASAADGPSPQGHASSPASGLVLNLRKWYDFQRSRELRCFVLRRRLVAVCQRYGNENAETMRNAPDSVLRAVRQFYADVVMPRVALPSFAFDVHLSAPRGGDQGGALEATQENASSGPRRHDAEGGGGGVGEGAEVGVEGSLAHDTWSGSRVTLIDVNPCAATTNPGLFSWEELSALRASLCEEGEEVAGVIEMRFADAEDSQRTPSEAAAFGFPHDFLNNLREEGVPVPRQ